MIPNDYGRCRNWQDVADCLENAQGRVWNAFEIAANLNRDKKVETNVCRLLRAFQEALVALEDELDQYGYYLDA